MCVCETTEDDRKGGARERGGRERRCDPVWGCICCVYVLCVLCVLCVLKTERTLHTQHIQSSTHQTSTQVHTHSTTQHRYTHTAHSTQNTCTQYTAHLYSTHHTPLRPSPGACPSPQGLAAHGLRAWQLRLGKLGGGGCSAGRGPSFSEEPRRPGVFPGPRKLQDPTCIGTGRQPSTVGY